MKASFEKRRENPLIHRNAPLVAILALLILSNFIALVGNTAGDPVLQDNLDGTTTASWSFQNPVNYTSENVSVSPSNVTLRWQSNQTTDTTIGDFQQGNLLQNMDIASDPGNVTLQDTSSAGIWGLTWVSIEDGGGKDAYINRGSKNRNYGISATLDVEPIDQKRILIEFNLS
ncbi:MAG: hypothetical protein KAW09_10815, partial [Thermoplasmata archaeon]|nr:hypothetical protein [Thermoplasmata archaeon]